MFKFGIKENIRSSVAVFGEIFLEEFSESTGKTGFGTFDIEEVLSFQVILERLLGDQSISR